VPNSFLAGVLPRTLVGELMVGYPSPSMPKMADRESPATPCHFNGLTTRKQASLKS